MAFDGLPRFLLPRLSWAGPARPWAAAAGRGAASSHRLLAPRSCRPVAAQRGAAARGAMAGRAFHATASPRRDHHFDTLKFVRRLQSEGFTEEQAAAMMKVLNDVIEER